MAKNKKQRSLYELYKEEQKTTVSPKKKKDDEFRSLSELYNESHGTNYQPTITAQSDDIAPVKKTSSTNERTWFQKGGLSALDDGFQLRDTDDIVKTGLASATDLTANVGGGVLEIGEGVIDALAYLGGAASKMRGNNWMASQIQDFISKDIIDGEKIASYLVAPNYALKAMDADYEDYSVFGEKTDSLAQSGGQLLGTIGLQALGVPWFVTTGVTSFGGGVESAFNEGAGYAEAGVSAAITAGADILTEKLFGGSGLGEKGLINLSGLTKGIANKAVKALASWGIDVVSEGGEEVVASFITRLGNSLTYEREDTWKELLTNEKKMDEYIAQVGNSLFGKEAGEEYGEAFLGGAFLGFGMNAVKAGKSISQGTDYNTGLTTNEQKVFDKVYEDTIAEAEKAGKKLSKKEKAELYDNTMEKLKKGYITTDTIEEVLGGSTFEEYKSITDKEKALTDEISQLENIPQIKITVKQSERLAEARKELENLTGKTELKTQLTDVAKSQIDLESKKLKDRGSYLAESYNEIARKGQAFEADLTKYKGKQKEAVERAIKSGVLNNTNRSHELVDTLSRIEADKGIIFDYTDNAKLKESGFALGGKTVNGFEKNGTVTLNVQSAKSWQSTVGHEITHVLEGTEAYTELQKALFKYAESKGELASRKAALTELYNGIDADIDKELTADLVGDYLFSDKDFINGLTTNKTLFQKVYDEIKYLCKVATGKELTEIEKVKREFDKVWEEFSAEGINKENAKTNYSIVALENGNVYVKASRKVIKGATVDEMRNDISNFFSNLLEGNSSLDIPTINGDVLTITKADTADKARDNYKTINGKRIKMTNAEFAVKLRVESHIDEVAEVSTQIGEKGDEKNHPIAKDGFTYRKAYFEDFDGQYYEVTLSIGNNGTVATVYNVGKIKESALPSAKIIAVVGSKPLGNSLSNSDIPQNSNDVKKNFSLSKSAEETKNLVAVHNMRVSELEKSLSLGGLPMPSIAIIKAQSGHSEYGDVSLVFDKNAIDPQKNKDNKVYGGDAWTPTYPTIEYKANREVADRVSKLYYGFAREYGYDEAKPLYNAAQDLEDELNRYKGEASLIEAYKDNIKLMNFYLRHSGKGAVEPIQKETRTEMSDAQVEMNEHFINELGMDVVADVMARGDESPSTHRKNYWETHGEKIKAAYGKLLSEKYGFDAESVENVLANTRTFDYLKLVRDAYSYHKNGRVTIKTETDKAATEEAIRQKAEDGYSDWIDDLFKGAEEKSGIRNNVDYFTPMGERRSFEALHWENNLENVVRVMRSQEETGGGALISGFGIFGVSAKNYNSIDEIKADADRLTHIPEEEYKEIRKGFSQRLNEICESIMDKTERNQFIALDNACECVVDAIRTSKTKSGILNSLKQYPQLTVTETTVNDIVELVTDISNMPTEYFEAKPRRAMSFDEVATAIIPDNASVELKQMLTDNGVRFVEYESGNEQARLNVLNSLEEAKFSLSKQGEQIAPIGNYSTPLNETALAPVREDVASNSVVEENTAIEQTDDIEPMPTDADAPPVMETEYYNTPDTTALDNKTLQNIGKSLRETLSLTAEETKAIQEIVQEYSTSEMPNSEKLFNIIKEKFGEKITKNRLDEVADVKRWLRTQKIRVSKEIKADFADYSQFRKRNQNKIAFSEDGLSVDTYYGELVKAFPGIFHYGYDEDCGDLTVPANQVRKLEKEANKEIYEYKSRPLDDEFIQEAVNIVLNEVRGYKENLARIAAEDTAREALDSVTPSKAEQLIDGSRGDALLRQSLDNFPIKTVEDKIAEKLRAVEGELADNKQLRRETESNYNKQIEKLTEEYLGLKNNRTKKADNIIRRISRLNQLKASADAEYAKRIGDLEARIEKMNTEQYNRAVHKQDKMQEHADWAENLIGDTSTWKDKKIGLQYATNTERRNLRDIVKDADGNADIAKADAIDDALNGQYNREEAAKKRELAQVRGKYAELKITKAEDAYIQMLGELRHNPDTELTEEVVNEYYEKHKNKIDKAKVDKVIELARQDYDNLLNRVNAELRKQGMKEIPYRQGYFPHFTEPKQNFIQKLLNWKTQDNEIPTSIAGLTETFKPVKSWQSFDKQRHGDTTDYSFLKGFDNYSQGALDWVYHLDTLQKRRAVENHIRFTHSDEGIQARIKEVYANEEMDANEAQAQIEHILAEAKNPLNNFIQDFTTHTNILAGKKNSLDRTVEQATNRHIYSVMTNVQNRMSANMVLANVRSALTNFIPITQSWAQVSPLRSLQATKDTIANAIKDDGMIDKSTFLTNRLKEVDNLYNTAWDKVLDKAGIMFEIVDNFSSQVIWRSKYNDNLAKGMSESEAIKNADQFAENVMAGRSKGNEPTLFNAKNPLVKAFTMFQLEVNNQYGYFFKDVPNDLKAETNHWKLNLAKGYTTAFVGAYVYNALLEQVAGSGAALDPIGIIEDLLRDLGLFDDDEEKEADEVIMNLVENVGGELPFVGGTVFGGGRIPISSALPYGDNGLIDGVGTFVEDVSEGNWGNIGKEMMAPILNIGLPVGGGQIKKTVQGLKMFNTDEEHPVAGSYTDSGALRFPVEDTVGNRIQAGIFGQWANENAREYIDNEYAPLKEKQIQEYVDVDLPIADYWKYRDGLKGLKTNAEKADYINSLDIEDWQKNLLMNNILDRKEDVDMSNYDDYADFEEFDYAQKNPEKYEFFKANGISYTDYANADEDGKKAYTWAYNNPEKYKVSKVVADNVVEYRSYTSELSDIRADKDSNGDSISGSAKEKKIEYINNLDLEYGQKIILFKMQFKTDDTYNADIVNYLNNLETLTYDERVAIYTELGFTVKDGYVYWD